MCDSANADYTSYDKERIGESDVACSFMFVRNARDLCIWYYDPEENYEEVLDESYEDWLRKIDY